MANPFVIVDVFAERRHAGNQLAVVEADGTESTAELQLVAREFGFSETAFLMPAASGSGGRPPAGVPFGPGDAVEATVRIFTPAEELPFAGHPTLGAAWVVRRAAGDGDAAGAAAIAGAFRTAAPGEVILHEGVGPIRTWFDGAGPDAMVWMQQNPPVCGRTYGRAAAAKALGLEAADIHPRLPVEHVSTGIPFVIVPLLSLDAVRRARPHPEAAAALFGPDEPVPIFLFARGAEETGHDLRARMFAPQYGITEDPATGSANGCLAGYLVRHRAFGDGVVAVTVEQGYEMGRPSVLYLRAEPAAEDGSASSIIVRVGGRVRLVATGVLV